MRGIRNLQPVKEVPVKSPVAGEKAVALNCGMCADEKIHHHVEPLAAAVPVSFPGNSGFGGRIVAGSDKLDFAAQVGLASSRLD